MFRVRTDLVTKEVKQLNLSGFKGVDFSSSPLKASKQRATESQNFIYDGNIHKRYGWKEVAQATGKKINGIYPYMDSTTQMYLVYAHDGFYTLQFTGDYGYELTAITPTPAGLADDFVDLPVEFYEQDSRIFIIGNQMYLVWHKPVATWILENVYENAITYIPTTTIGIDCSDLIVRTQATLERPNILSRWRKNTARTKDSGDADPTIHSWIMDGAIASNTLVTVVVTTLDSGVLTPHTLVNSSGGWTVLSEGATAVGHVTFATGVVLIDDVVGAGSYCRPSASDNVVITFRSATASAVITDVTTARFGALFGVDGVTSQLFLGGNQTNINRDYYSYPLDFTYYPDDYYREVGNSAITGYTRIADGTLLIFKAETTSEAAYFVRSGTLTTATVSGYKSAAITYTERAGYAGNYLSTKTDSYGFPSPQNRVANFAGDNVYLTETGLKGIVLTSNVAVDERYARERSRFIDTSLCAHDLTTACCVVHDNKLYIAVDGVCYVADARYKTQGDEDMKDTFNYEWFYWTNIGTLTNPVTCWMSYDGDLYFGTKDGKICLFDTEYTDRTITLVANGSISIHSADDRVVYNSALSFTEGDLIRFNDDHLHHVLFNSTDITYSSGVFHVKTMTAVYTAVTVATNRITLTAHGLGANDSYVKIKYIASTGTVIGGLATGTVYTVKIIDANTIEFNDSLNVTDITSQGTGTHEFMTATGANLLWLEEETAVEVVALDAESAHSHLLINTIDLGAMTFKLKTTGGTNRTMADISAAGTILVSQNITGVDCYIDQVNEVVEGGALVDHEFTLRRYEDGDVIYLTYYLDSGSPYYDDTKEISTADGLTAMVTSAVDVEATWYTPVFDCGTNVFSKDLLSITLSAEPVERGEITFGYETRQTLSTDKTNNLTSFSFDDVDFNDFAFQTTFTTSCTRKVKERAFNFIMFRFVSDNKYACEINDFTARFKIHSMNKGVK